MKDLIDEQHKMAVEKNREYIKTIADTLRLTAIQNIAQRGHRETNDEENKGNFLEILGLLSNYSEPLRSRLKEGPANAKYTHHSVQNALLEIMSDLVLQEIKSEVADAKLFSVLVDETKDLSKSEQMSIVIRYFFDGEIHEEFLGFRKAEALNAQSLSEYIQEELRMCGIDIQNLVAQAYDGASVMSGSCSGVQQRIREIVPQAVYIHCMAHKLNLVIVDAVKSIIPVADFFTVLQMCYVFLSGSSVHAKWVNYQKEMYADEEPVAFKSFSDTR